MPRVRRQAQRRCSGGVFQGVRLAAAQLRRDSTGEVAGLFSAARPLRSASRQSPSPGCPGVLTTGRTIPH
ncbi:hypothetical protein C5C18_03800 [Rathayibacter tritici]|nr:hypothetical protein C5C06_00500 [Rathayibacter tritici]PPF70238.1 hypothetical protein C5C21_01350 [Rathayibacter tritici]PPG08521.1 hypothetical protein C5C18_03800 [Rathayibacter tritici]PPI13068.1 hypothetical protein C5D07_11180 [Rathayibacter tritici]